MIVSDLSDSLWKLLFFLNLTPLGLVMTVCLGFPLSVDEENNAALIHFFKMTVKPIGYILLLLAILSFYGLLSAINGELAVKINGGFPDPGHFCVNDRIYRLVLTKAGAVF